MGIEVLVINIRNIKMKLLKIFSLLLLFTIDMFSSELTEKWNYIPAYSSISKLKISHDGKYILGYNGLAQIFDVERKRFINEFNIGYSNLMEISNNFEYAYFRIAQCILRINLKTGDTVNSRLVTGDTDIKSMSSSKDGNKFVAVYLNVKQVGNIKYPTTVYDWGIIFGDFNRNQWKVLDTGTSKWGTSVAQNSSVAISDNAMYAAISNDSSYINIYDIQATESPILIDQIETKGTGQIISLAFSNDGSRIISSHNDGGLRVWDIQSKQLLFESLSSFKKVYLLNQYSNDNVISVKFQDEKSKMDSLFLFDIMNKELTFVRTADRTIYNNYLINDSLNIITYISSNSKWMIDFPDMKMEYNISNNHIPRAINYASKNDKFIFLGNNDSLIYVHNIINGEQEKVLNTVYSPIKKLVVSKDGSKMLVVAGDYFQIWNLETLEKKCERKILKYYEKGKTVAATIHPDNSSFFVAVDTSTIREFDCYFCSFKDETKIKMDYTREIIDLVFNSDGSVLAFGNHYDETNYVRYEYNFLNFPSKLITKRFKTTNGNYNSQMFAEFIDDSTLFTSFTGYSIESKTGEYLIWDVNNSNKLRNYKLPDKYRPDGFEDRFVIFRQHNLIILYNNVGHLVLYNYESNNHNKIINTSMYLVKIFIDEENKLLYTTSTKGSVKCFDISNLLDPVSVKDDTDYNNLQYIYPNPVSDVLYLKNIDNYTNVDIFNSLGVKIMSFDKVEQINVSNLSAGLYFIKMGKYTQKFVVLR